MYKYPRLDPKGASRYLIPENPHINYLSFAFILLFSII